MDEKEVRAQLYKALDQVELYRLNNIVEDIMKENGLDQTRVFTCEACEKLYGECQDADLDGKPIKNPCEERFYRHYGIEH